MSAYVRNTRAPRSISRYATTSTSRIGKSCRRAWGGGSMIRRAVRSPMGRGRSGGRLTHVTGEARRILDDGTGRGEEGRGAVGGRLVVEVRRGDRLLDQD